jgi:peroxiredoxin
MSPPYADRLARQRERLPFRTGPLPFDLQEYRGRVLVVCAGAAGGAQTEVWLRRLALAHRQGLPEGVEVVWLAVGSDAAEVSRLAREQELPFPVHADPVGSAAQRLNHWLDPTLYVIGRWGAVRYTGELQLGQLNRMLVMLTKEREDGDHQVFSMRGADVGHQAPGFALPDLDGRSVTLESLLGAASVVGVFFAGTELRAAPRMTEWLEGLVERSGSTQLQMCVVHSLVTAGAVRRVYTRVPARVRVLTDESGEVARSYRAEEGPAWLIIGPRGVVRYREERGAGFAQAVSAFLGRPGSSPSGRFRPLPP